MKKLLLLLSAFPTLFQPKAQLENCTFKDPLVAIQFGTGDAGNINSKSLFNYRPVSGYCPTDGHYTYTPYTSECFRNDWHTLTEDHTPGDVNGNMMLVNASPVTGTFFITAVNGLKSGATYEFGVWMMNVCKITEKCPFPLLPDITIRLQTANGNIVAQLNVGEVQRRHKTEWTQYKMVFKMPASATALTLNMMNNNPGGCGNDFAMDDITFRECVPPIAAVKKAAKPVVKKKPTTTKAPPKTATVKAKPKSTTVKPKPKTTTTKPKTPVAVKRSSPPVKPPIKQSPPVAASGPSKEAIKAPSVAKRTPPILPPPPPALRTRANVLAKRIMTDAGQIKLDLYDNAEIDGDTVSIYHNNRLVVSRAKLSAKPITLNVTVNAGNPHHEFVMVANNLGSIPPNTSLMIVTAGGNRHEVFISSTQQNNAKVILDLKE